MRELRESRCDLGSRRAPDAPQANPLAPRSCSSATGGAPKSPQPRRRGGRGGGRSPRMGGSPRTGGYYPRGYHPRGSYPAGRTQKPTAEAAWPLPPCDMRKAQRRRRTRRTHYRRTSDGWCTDCTQTACSYQHDGRHFRPRSPPLTQVATGAGAVANDEVRRQSARGRPSLEGGSNAQRRAGQIVGLVPSPPQSEPPRSHPDLPPPIGGWSYQGVFPLACTPS